MPEMPLEELPSHEVPEKPQPGMQRVAIMRHGRRYDTDMPTWSSAAAHPWDTPISGRGSKELDGLGPHLECLQPEIIVVSPFLRCLQTTERVVKSWKTKPAGLRIIVDRQLSEIYSPSLLHLTEHPSWFAIGKRWWWQRKWQERATAHLGKLGCTLEFCNRAWPSYPESKATGRDRMSKATTYWAGQVKGNVLIITHGDAVLSGVGLVGRFRDVINVSPGAFCVLARVRSQGRDGHPGAWQMDESLVAWNGVELQGSAAKPTNKA